MKKLTNKEFIKKSNLVHNNKYDYSLSNYINNKTKIKIMCLIHGEFEQIPKAHLNGQGCKKCNKNIPTNEEFKQRLKKIYGNELDYSLVKYENIRTKITLVCKKHGTFKQRPDHLLFDGMGCRKCNNEKIYLNKAKEVHGDTYNYDLVKYEKSHKQIDIICKKHGKFKQLAYQHTNNSGCPKCKESKGEKEIRNYLLENNIIFETQKTFNDCKFKNKLKFDFYLPNYNLCIEYDGEQHFMLKEFWGGQKEFEKIQKRDKIKTQYCIDNNINLLRIKYDKDIKLKINLYFLNI